MSSLCDNSSSLSVNSKLFECQLKVPLKLFTDFHDIYKSLVSLKGSDALFTVISTLEAVKSLENDPPFPSIVSYGLFIPYADLIG